MKTRYRKKHLYILLPLFLFHLSTGIYAQNNIDSNSSLTLKSDTLKSTLKDDFNTAFNTGCKIAVSPLHYDGHDWLIAGLGAAATGLTMLADDDVRTMFKKNHSKLLDNISEVGYRYGSGGYAFALSGALYLGGKIFNSESVSTTGRMLIESLVFSGIASTVIKTVIGRSRPYTGAGPYKFSGFQIKTETTSFPSGHSTVAFALSSVLAERIDNVYASILLYTISASTVMQRIYDDKHWASDTVLGGLIGYFIGKAVVKYDQGENRISIGTYSSAESFGLSLHYSL